MAANPAIMLIYLIVLCMIIALPIILILALVFFLAFHGKKDKKNGQDQ